jgi:Putative MetA-pathway of phenol degradation
MKLIQSTISISMLFFVTLLQAQFTDQINSNRPGKSAGAYAVGKNVIQLETGLFYINDNHPLLDYNANGLGIDFQARGGLLKEQLELTLDAQFQMDKYKTSYFEENRSGFKNLTFGAKYLFYDPYKAKEEKPNIYSWKANHKFKWKQLIPAISGYIGVNYAMQNAYAIPEEASISPKAMVITQNQFGQKWVLVTNIFFDKITSITRNYGYFITVTRAINDKWSAFIENKGVNGDYYSDGIFTLGATHLLKDNIQIDASISKNIKDTPSLIYGGIGFSYRFDKKHKDIKMKDGKEEKETKEQKEAKSNIKSQEELDKIQAKANKKARKNKTAPPVEDTNKPEEPKKKRLDNFDPEKQ